MGFPDGIYRNASFIAPSGDEFPFLTDTLERLGGKKGGTQEILDSGESIAQDLGNKVTTFPFNIYFPGDFFNLDSDEFYEALEQKYTQQNPGILIHPRWGDVDVWPVSWSQREEQINGAKISRIEVVFSQMFPKVFPTTDVKSIDEALTDIDDMEVVSQELTGNIALETLAAISNVAAKIQGAVGVVSNSLAALTAGIEGIEDTFNSIQSGIDGLLDDVAGNIFLLMAATQRLIRTPGRIIDSTLGKINTYSDMITEMGNSIFDSNETDPVNKRNNAILLQLLTGFSVAATAEAAVFTDYSIRSKIISAVDIINDSFDNYDSIFNDARPGGSISQEFSGDHNFYSLLLDSMTRINDGLLNQAFDLKAEKSYLLKTNSDIITECYKNYGDIQTDTLNLFINTNKFIDNDFIEIPSGKEIVVYI